MGVVALCEIEARESIPSCPGDTASRSMALRCAGANACLRGGRKEEGREREGGRARVRGERKEGGRERRTEEKKEYVLFAVSGAPWGFELNQQK